MNFSDTFSQSGLFVGIKEDELSEIFSFGHRRVFESGATLFREGHPALNSYLVIKGRLKLSKPIGPQNRSGYSDRFPPQPSGFGRLYRDDPVHREPHSQHLGEKGLDRIGPRTNCRGRSPRPGDLCGNRLIGQRHGFALLYHLPQSIRFSHLHLICAGAKTKTIALT